MDLELIGKQILEALAVQGQIAGLETKLANLEGRIVEAGKKVRQTKVDSVLGVESRKQAEIALEEAHNKVVLMESLLATAEKNLGVAEEAADKAKVKAGKYSEDVLKQLDWAVQQAEEAQKAIEVGRDDVLKEIGIARKGLEARQKALSIQGIELNIGATKQPKVTTL